MLELKNRKKNPGFLKFWILIKKWANSSCKVGFDIPPLQALNLSPLAREVDFLPTWAEVYNISWVLHCFDVALPNQHFTYIIDDSSNFNKVMKLLFCECYK